MNRDVAIEEYLEYAKERARWWASKHPMLAKDIMATSMIALIKAVDMHPRSMKGCISRLIDNAIAQLINDNDLIRIPRSTRYDITKGGGDLEALPKAEAVDPCEIYKKAKTHPTWVMMHRADVIDLLNLSDYEAEILEMREQSYTLEEIGLRLKRTKQTIHYALESIGDRYQRLTKRHPEILKPYE